MERGAVRREVTVRMVDVGRAEPLERARRSGMHLVRRIMVDLDALPRCCNDFVRRPWSTVQ